MPLWPNQVKISPDHSIAFVHDRFNDHAFLYEISSEELFEVNHQQIHFFSNQTYALWSDLSISVWSYETLPPSQIWDQSYETEFSPMFKGGQIWIEKKESRGDLPIVVDAQSGSVLPEMPTKPEIMLPSGRLINFPNSESLSARLLAVTESEMEDLTVLTYTIDLFDRLSGEIVSNLSGSLETESVKNIDFLTRSNVLPGARVRLALSWDTKKVAIGIGGSAKVWDRQSGRLLLDETHSETRCEHLVFSNDGKAIALQFAYSGIARIQSLCDLSETPRQVLSEEFPGRVNVRFSDVGLILETVDEDQNLVEIEYNLISGDLLDERQSLGTNENVRFSGRKPFEVGIRIVEETEDEGGVTQILAAELGDDTGFQLGLTVNGVRPTRGQWIRNLEGVMVSHRFPFEGSRNPLFKWEPRAEGLWLSEESAIVVGVADSVSMWNYETGEQLFTLRLGAEDLRRSVNTVAYFVKPVRLSQDGGRILVTLSEQVYDTKSGDVRQSELKTFRMIDIARQEVLSLPVGQTHLNGE
jgi:WD40 repeat protein